MVGGLAVLNRILLCGFLFVFSLMLGCGGTAEVAPSAGLEDNPIEPEVEAQMDPDYMLNQAKKAQDAGNG